MNTLRQLCNNDPSIVIRALIDGLLGHESIKDFKLDFNYTGEWKDDVCLGGAATLVLIELQDLNYAPPELDNSASKAVMMYTDRQDLIDFEEAIRYFCAGDLSAIEEYFGLPISGLQKDWNLQNDNWKDELPKVIHSWERLTKREYIFVEKPREESWIEAMLPEPPSTALDYLYSMIFKGSEYNEAIHLAAEKFKTSPMQLDIEYCQQQNIAARG